MVLFNKTTGKEISSSVKIADTFFSRLAGLIPRSELNDNEGLFLSPCAMIHMCFMKFPIDAVFVDSDMKVLRIFLNLKPWRFSSWVRRSYGVLELPAGKADGNIRVGDSLELK